MSKMDQCWLCVCDLDDSVLETTDICVCDDCAKDQIIG